MFALGQSICTNQIPKRKEKQVFSTNVLANNCTYFVLAGSESSVWHIDFNLCLSTHNITNP